MKTVGETTIALGGEKSVRNEQIDQHQGFYFMRYGSESKGHQPVKTLFFSAISLRKRGLTI